MRSAATGSKSALSQFCSPLDISSSKAYFQGFTEVLARIPFNVIDEVAQLLAEAYRDDRSLFVFGNGGSAALASHSACDLGKGTAANGNRRFRVLSLTDNVPLMTAWANDQQYDDIFAEQLRTFVRPDDVAFAISGSGNSANVLNGLQVARESGARTVGLTGFHGGKMKMLCDLCIVIPSDNMQLIEDFHIAVSHSIFMLLRKEILAQCESSQ